MKKVKIIPNWQLAIGKLQVETWCTVSLLCIIPFLLGNLQLSAQQDPLFSQYMFNRLIINPGYTGSTNTLYATLAYRQQFAGLEGAPQTQAFTIHAPVNKKSMGLGIKAIHQNIGVTNQNMISAIYAYHLGFAKGRLSLGLEGGIFNQSIDFTNLRKTVQDDNAVPAGKESALVPDAAFGVYYHNDKFYTGASVYHLLQSRIDYTGYERDLVTQLSRHYFLTGGYSINTGENIRIDPSLLLKYVSGAPPQIDVNANVTFKETFAVGGAYRTGDAVVFLFQYNFKNRIKFGYAYDYTISELASYSNGSHGIMLSYSMSTKKKVREAETEEEMIAEISSTDTLSVFQDSSGDDSLAISVTPTIEDTLNKVTEEAFVEESADTPATVPAIIELPADSLAEATSTVEPEIIVKDTLVIDEGVKDIVFRIQIHASKERVFMAPANFQRMENVEEYQEEELYKYVVESSYSYDYAKDVLLNQVRRQGFQDAFIVAYRKGTRISVKDALKLLKK
mgnify:CR=1 FL=1